MNQYKALAVAVCPAFLVTVIYEMLLGHRHDYSGHYAAGYGATFAAAMFLLRIVDNSEIQLRQTWFVTLFCIACISGGAIAEATVFRIAKFDEIDFFNQSIGAVLATICAAAYIGSERCTESDFNNGILFGIVFLGVGCCLAVA